MVGVGVGQEYRADPGAGYASDAAVDEPGLVELLAAWALVCAAVDEVVSVGSSVVQHVARSGNGSECSEEFDAKAHFNLIKIVSRRLVECLEIRVFFEVCLGKVLITN